MNTPERKAQVLKAHTLTMILALAQVVRDEGRVKRADLREVIGSWPVAVFRELVRTLIAWRWFTVDGWDMLVWNTDANTKLAEVQAMLTHAEEALR